MRGVLANLCRRQRKAADESTCPRGARTRTGTCTRGTCTAPYIRSIRRYVQVTPALSGFDSHTHFHSTNITYLPNLWAAQHTHTLHQHHHGFVHSVAWYCQAACAAVAGVCIFLLGHSSSGAACSASHSGGSKAGAANMWSSGGQLGTSVRVAGGAGGRHTHRPDKRHCSTRSNSV